MIIALMSCPILALTDDYAMSALTVAIWGNPDQICSMRDFLRMTPSRHRQIEIPQRSSLLP
jgi:hypothetical protein